MGLEGGEGVDGRCPLQFESLEGTSPETSEQNLSKAFSRTIFDDVFSNSVPEIQKENYLWGEIAGFGPLTP